MEIGFKVTSTLLNENWILNASNGALIFCTVELLDHFLALFWTAVARLSPHDQTWIQFCQETVFQKQLSKGSMTKTAPGLTLFPLLLLKSLENNTPDLRPNSQGQVLWMYAAWMQPTDLEQAKLQMCRWMPFHTIGQRAKEYLLLW